MKGLFLKTKCNACGFILKTFDTRVAIFSIGLHNDICENDELGCDILKVEVPKTLSLIQNRKEKHD